MSVECSRILSVRALAYCPPLSMNKTLVHVDLDVEAGECVVLTGPTGSGKSTVLGLIRGLAAEWGGWLSGRIEIDGRSFLDRPPGELGAMIGYLAQNPSAQLHQKTVLQELGSGPLYMGLTRVEGEKRARQVARRIGLEHLLDRDVGTLSTGEQQLVAFAAILAMKPRMLLLDEPTAYLDPWADEWVIRLITDEKAEGVALVIATHQPERFSTVADRLVELQAGRSVFQGTIVESLLDASLTSSAGPFPRTLRLMGYTCANQIPSRWTDIPPGRLEPFLRGHSIAARIAPAKEVISLERFSSRARGGFSLSDVSVKLDAGSLGVVVGPNGGGKTTLLRSILGFVRSAGGTIKLLGSNYSAQSPRSRAPLIGYACQNPADMLFQTDALAECSFRPRMLGVPNPSGAAKVALEQLGVAELAGRDPGSLSGGEQRLVTIAAALAGGSSCLLLDEPEFGLDPNCRNKMWAVLHSIARQGMCVLVITHDIDGAALNANWLGMLSEGQLSAGAVRLSDLQRNEWSTIGSTGCLLAAACHLGVSDDRQFPLHLGGAET